MQGETVQKRGCVMFFSLPMSIFLNQEGSFLSFNSTEISHLTPLSHSNTQKTRLRVMCGPLRTVQHRTIIAMHSATSRLVNILKLLNLKGQCHEIFDHIFCLKDLT